MESRVYILGAGCSFDPHHGYPLASQFLPTLMAFASKISSDSQKKRILNAVQETIDLLTRCQSGSSHASTIDQMVNLILRHQIDSHLTAIAGVNSPSMIQMDQLRRQAVRKAKIATAACFLDKEEEARGALIGRYRNFIEHKILHDGGSSIPTLVRLRKSAARVLSFNYDRMFELAFFASFGDGSLKGQYAYSLNVLNSGLEVGGEIGECESDRFCFIKLHGSIGLLCNENDFGQRAQPISDVANWAPIPIWDAHFFSDQPTRHAFRDSLIVFPYEKDFVMSNSNNKFVFRDYVTKAWAQAAKIIQEASEIWVIGYSFDPTDCKYLISHLKNAKKCQRIVIQNLKDECDRIEQLLRIDEGLKIPIEKKTTLF
jgi:hypothetical protein